MKQLAENIHYWNCRGAKSVVFLREVKELMRVHQLMIVVLLEPKISGENAMDVCKQLRKSHWIRSEADGFSGGIWVLWDGDSIQVSPRYIYHQFIHMEVVSGRRRRWEFSAVYASPQAFLQRDLWNALNHIFVDVAWVLVGDFNCVLKPEERSSEGGVSSRFVDWWPDGAD